MQTFFTHAHAIVTNGSRVFVEDSQTFVTIAAKNEFGEIALSLDRRAAEQLYRDLDGKLTLSDMSRVPDHDVRVYVPGSGL